MHMSKVESSNLESVGYSPSTRMLYVRFKSGQIYSYGKVDAYLYEGLLHAPSHGHYLAKNIKPFHPVEKVPDEDMPAYDETAAQQDG